MNKSITIFIIIVILLIITSLSIASSNKSSLIEIGSANHFSPSYTKETYMVEMRDGIHLATDAYFPNDISQPMGSILIRTPYNKNNMNMGEWADAGWPTAVQDMRGRYESEGVDTVFRNAHTDGPDTLEWIAAQSWSNGKIATYGGSALGINQYYMAGSNPENLACQYIQVATPNLHNHAIYQGGQFRKAITEGWLEGQNSLFVLPELIAHENYTLDYWTNTSLEDNWSDVNVPAVHIGGWYDCFAQGTIDGFMGYQYLGGNGAKGQSKLIMGPWTHGASTQAGELQYPENALPDFPFELFVDMIYKYTENGEYDGPIDYQTWPAVSYYVLGDVNDIDAPGNEWRFSDDWPIQSNKKSWYFHEDGILSVDKPSDQYSFNYLYDPTNPVPTVGGQNLNLPRGPYDQRSVENREDVLVFTSSILEEPYEATGPIKATLFVSSNCLDTDFTVKLCDVYPDGRSMLITDGILRMRNRNGFDHWDFISPGEVYGIEVSLWSTSYIWNAGHKIRVSISSSNYPRFLANPNTIDPIKGNSSYNIAENTLYTGGAYSSCILLPEIKKPSSNPPDIPEPATGPLSGRHNTEYTYESVSIDPDGDDIYLLFDWGDGSRSGWVGPFASGKTGSATHSWSGFGEKTYQIKVKAKDIHDVESDWSETVTITLPKNKALSFFHHLIEILFGHNDYLLNILNNIF